MGSMSEYQKNDVLCIGSPAIDLVFLVEDFPSPDQISLAHWCKQFCGGSSANVSVGLSRLGLYSGLIGKVGRDPEGVTLLNRLISEGVDIRTVKVTGKTARTVILLTEKGEKTIITDTECVLKSENELPQEFMAEAKAVYIGDCFLPVAQKAVEVTRDTGIVRVLRLKNVHVSSGLDIGPLFDADFVIMNEKTFSYIGEPRENFIITRGKNGCYYVKEDITIEGIPVDPVDTTGAGDAFCAGFIYLLVKKSPVEKALQFANAAGAAATTRYGAMDSMPSRKEVESLLKRPVL
jgi:ribokinase